MYRSLYTIQTILVTQFSSTIKKVNLFIFPKSCIKWKLDFLCNMRETILKWWEYTNKLHLQLDKFVWLCKYTIYTQIVIFKQKYLLKVAMWWKLRNCCNCKCKGIWVSTQKRAAISLHFVQWIRVLIVKFTEKLDQPLDQWESLLQGRGAATHRRVAPARWTPGDHRRRTWSQSQCCHWEH